MSNEINYTDRWPVVDGLTCINHCTEFGEQNGAKLSDVHPMHIVDCYGCTILLHHRGQKIGE